MIKIEKQYYFYAAHRNKQAGEKCGRIHGHTYDIICTFKFNEINNGVTMLFSDIDSKVEPLIKQYDHWLLVYEKDALCKVLIDANEPYKVLPFETSAENLAMYLFKIIKQVMPIVKIELRETKTSNVIYEPKN